MLPPDTEPKWEENTPVTQAALIAYQMIREYEEQSGGCPMVGKK